MVEIGGYTGRKIDEGACPVCGETDLCCLNDPEVKCLPPKWKVDQMMKEHFRNKLQWNEIPRDKSDSKQMKL